MNKFNNLKYKIKVNYSKSKQVNRSKLTNKIGIYFNIAKK